MRGGRPLLGFDSGPEPGDIFIQPLSGGSRGIREGAVDLCLYAFGGSQGLAPLDLRGLFLAVYFHDVEVAAIAFEGAGGNEGGLHFAEDVLAGLFARHLFYY